jgi:hypothetical protein
MYPRRPIALHLLDAIAVAAAARSAATRGKQQHRHEHAKMPTRSTAPLTLLVNFRDDLVVANVLSDLVFERPACSIRPPTLRLRSQASSGETNEPRRVTWRCELGVPARLLRRSRTRMFREKRNDRSSPVARSRSVCVLTMRSSSGVGRRYPPAGARRRRRAAGPMNSASRRARAIDQMRSALKRSRRGIDCAASTCATRAPDESPPAARGPDRAEARRA